MIVETFRMTPRQFAVFARDLTNCVYSSDGQRPVFVRLDLDGDGPKALTERIPADTALVEVWFEEFPGESWSSLIRAETYHGALSVTVEPEDAMTDRVRRAVEAYWRALRERLITAGYAVQVAENAEPAARSEPKPTRLQRKPPGRPPYPGYDKAADLIKNGASREDAFRYYCERENITSPTKSDRDSFKRAMDRRGAPK